MHNIIYLIMCALLLDALFLLVVGISGIKNKKIILSTFYFYNLLIILFFRNKHKLEVFNFDVEYLFKWIKILDSNPIVLVNISLNILLFIPFGIIIYKKYIFKTLIFGLCVIILIELIQGFTRLGVFDLVDIILNFIGLIFGVICKYIYKKIKD